MFSGEVPISSSFAMSATPIPAFLPHPATTKRQAKAREEVRMREVLKRGGFLKRLATRVHRVHAAGRAAVATSAEWFNGPPKELAGFGREWCEGNGFTVD